MYIISLIFAIIACISSLLPLYGIIFTLILGIVSIVLSILNMRSEQKKIKEVSIISLIVSIFSFVMCIGINVYTAFLSNDSNNAQDITFNNLSEDYPVYKAGDNVKDDNLLFNIENVKEENNTIILDYNMTFYGDEREFSAFDIYLLDQSLDHVYYLTYDGSSDYVYTAKIGNGESLSGKVKFTLGDDYNIDNLYLVYKDNNSNFKIKV